MVEYLWGDLCGYGDGPIEAESFESAGSGCFLGEISKQGLGEEFGRTL
jgi:hypothetical protein